MVLGKVPRVPLRLQATACPPAPPPPPPAPQQPGPYPPASLSAQAYPNGAGAPPQNGYYVPASSLPAAGTYPAAPNGGQGYAVAPPAPYPGGPPGGMAPPAPAPQDLTQRLLMEQMAVLQRQLMDMASLVATTQAQNAALASQLNGMQQQMAAQAAGQGMGQAPGWGVAPQPAQSLPHQPAEEQVPQPVVPPAAPAQATHAAAATQPASEPAAVSASAPAAPAAAAVEVAVAAASAAAPSEPATAPGFAVKIQVAPPPPPPRPSPSASPMALHVRPAPPPHTVTPAPAAPAPPALAASSSTSVQEPAVASAASGAHPAAQPEPKLEPAPPAAAATGGAPPADLAAQLQQLSSATEQLKSAFASLTPTAPSPPAAAAPPAVAAAQDGGRQGGRYVGPPRDEYRRSTPPSGSNGSARKAQISPPAGQQPPSPAGQQAATLPAAAVPAAAAPSPVPVATVPSPLPVAAEPAASAPAAASAVAVAVPVPEATADTPAEVPPAAAAAAPQGDASDVQRRGGEGGGGFERRIRSCRTAVELRALTSEGWLSPANAVVAVQQLPRMARQLQEQQAAAAARAAAEAAAMAAREPAAAGGAGLNTAKKAKGAAKPEASAADKAFAEEAMTIKELHSRIISRFGSPGASAGPRPATLPHYVALAAASAELRLPPSRAFATAVRHLTAAALEAQDADPALLAAALAAVAQMDGTVAPGMLERGSRLLMAAAAVAAAGGSPAAGGEAQAAESDSEAEGEGEGREGGDAGAGKARGLLGWRALVAAGQVAGLGGHMAEAAKQVLAAAAGAAAAGGGAQADSGARVNAAALASSASAVLSCTAAGLAVPHVLLQPLEQASYSQPAAAGPGAQGSGGRRRGGDGGGRGAGAPAGLLHSLVPADQLALARAFVAAGYKPQARWVDGWEAAVVARLPLATPSQAAAMAQALHALSRQPQPSAAPRARPAFVAAVAGRLLPTHGSVASQAGTHATLCALALHLGELLGDADRVPRSQQLGSALLTAATAGALPSLDAPDLASLVSGLSLLDVPAPAEVWSALLSRATDAPALAAATTAAARRALSAGLPTGIKPAAFTHFLSVAGQHVGVLPAPSLVGLMHLAAAVAAGGGGAGGLRPSMLASVLTRLNARAVELGPADAALLFSAVEALSVPLTAPLTTSTAAVTAADEAAALAPAAVLRRVADACLQPDRVVAALGPEGAARLVETVARVQQAAAVGSASSSPAPVQLMSSEAVLALLTLLQPALPQLSPAALAALSGGCAALGVAAPPDWLHALVAAALAALPALGPLTAARIAAAVTKCESLAGLAPGGAGGWLDDFMEDAQLKIAAAPPAAMALTLQTLVAHGRRPSGAWAGAFLSAAMPFLEAPLPLTQAQAVGAAAAAAASTSKPKGTVKGTPAQAATSKTGSAAAASAGGKPTPAPAASSNASATFTPPQLAQILGGLASLQLGEYVTPAWLAAAAKQVDGRVVHFSYGDLVETLHGMLRLGGSVKEASVNQLVIVSPAARLAVASPALLTRTLTVVAAAGGGKVPPRWWDDAQKVIVAQLSGGGAGPAWTAPLLAQLIEAVLCVRRAKAGAKVGAPLAAAMAAALARDGGAAAAALPRQAAVWYVEACSEVPYFGSPPAALLERYLSYSAELLTSWNGAAEAAAEAQAAAAATAVAAPEAVGAEGEPEGTGSPEDEGEELPQQAGPGAAAVPAIDGNAKRRRKQARSSKRSVERAHSPLTTGGVPQSLVEHLPHALAVGRMLLQAEEAARPAAAGPWLAALVAAGAAAAGSMPAARAADVLWLAAKLGMGEQQELEGGEEEAGTPEGEGAGRAGRTAALVAALAQRVSDAPEWAAAAAGTTAPAAAGASEVAASAVDAAWALQRLGVQPGESLLQALAHELPRRLAGLAPQDALLLLHALATMGPLDTKAATAKHVMTAAAGTGAGSAAAPPPPPTGLAGALSAELGRYLAAHMHQLSDTEVLHFITCAGFLYLDMPEPVVTALGARAAAAFEPPAYGSGTAARPLTSDGIFNTIVGLANLGYVAPAETAEAFMGALERGAEAKIFTDLTSLANIAVAVRAIGATPDEEWFGVLYESLTTILNGGEAGDEAAEGELAAAAAAGGGDGSWEPRQRLTALELIKALALLAPAYPEVDFMIPALLTIQVTADQLEAQLAAGEAAAEGGEAAEEQQWPEPLTLEDVVVFLDSCAMAGQSPPGPVWELLERFMVRCIEAEGTALANAAIVSSGAGGGAARADAAFEQALQGMLQLQHEPGADILKALERRALSRMQVQSVKSLMVLVKLFNGSQHAPSRDFLTGLISRIEVQLMNIHTSDVIAMLNLYVQCLMLADPADKEWMARAFKKSAQVLLERTRGEEIVAMCDTPENCILCVRTLTVSVNMLELEPPHAGNEKESKAWSLALQAVMLGRFEEMGWDHVAQVVSLMFRLEAPPRPEWQAQLYGAFEAAMPAMSHADLSVTASTVATMGFQPHLAPTLAARLATQLEDRMTQLALEPSAALISLVCSLGRMRHVMRTPVLQAAEGVLCRHLEEAARAAQAGSMDAAASVLQGQVLEQLTQGFQLHCYRPGARFIEALTSAFQHLHTGTAAAAAAMSKARNGGLAELGALHGVYWVGLGNYAISCYTLLEWGVRPTGQWLEAAAIAATELASMDAERMEPDSYFRAVQLTVRELEGWGHRPTEPQIAALESFLRRVEALCKRQGLEYNASVPADALACLGRMRSGQLLESSPDGLEAGVEALHGSTFAAAAAAQGGLPRIVAPGRGAPAAAAEATPAEFRDLRPGAAPTVRVVAPEDVEPAAPGPRGAGGSRTSSGMSAEDATAALLDAWVRAEAADSGSDAEAEAGAERAQSGGAASAAAEGLGAGAAGVDAPSTRVPFRRRVPAGARATAAAGRRGPGAGAPPQPPVGGAATSSAAAQLLQLLDFEGLPRRPAAAGPADRADADVDVDAEAGAVGAGAKAAKGMGKGMGKGGKGGQRAMGGAAAPQGPASWDLLDSELSALEVVEPEVLEP